MIQEKAQPQELVASRTASIFSVGLALFKLTAGLNAGSLSLLASALDSIFDAVASFLGYILLSKSLEPADLEHPYGHSRIESMASLAQGALLFVISGVLLFGATQRFDHLHEPQKLASTIYVPLISSVVTFVLWLYLGKVVENTGSSIIAGDRLHYFGDLAGNILLSIGFAMSRIWHLFNVDAILTIILSLFMFSGAMKIVMDAITELVDHSDLEAEKEIKEIVTQFFPEALGINKIRSRKSGRRTALDIELLSCRLLKFQEVHHISHLVQMSILEKRPQLDIVIHSEPCPREMCPTDQSCRYQASK